MYITESLADYRQDFEELHYLLTDSINRLKRFLSDILKAKKYITHPTYEEITATAHHYIDACRTQIRMVTECNQAYEFLRTHQTLIGALITSTDWQSPTFLHATASQAGRQTNSIYATINDYKRDQHWDAHRYEQAFLKANIDGLIKFPIQVCATTSGMAAFTTILNYLMLEHKATRPVLIGKSIYFENKSLIKQAFGDLVVEVDESNTEQVIHAIDQYNPSIVFLDSLTNSPDIAVPDLTVITTHLVAHSKVETYLVLDNTCLSVMFQPYPLVFAKRSKLRLIVFESLNKYHQFGMDRVTGGIVWSYGGDTGKLFDYRVHLGTNIPDLVACSLPTPNRLILTKRLLRHHRNTSIITQSLQEWVTAHPNASVSEIVFPGLPNHPSYDWVKHRSFHGSYFMIRFKKKYRTISSYKRFVTAIIQTAKRSRVNLVSGTTFGTNTTRVYLTAIRSKPNTPFIRVSVGTENKQEVEAIITVFKKVFTRFHYFRILFDRSAARSS